jgi:hypothetical protein
VNRANAFAGVYIKIGSWANVGILWIRQSGKFSAIEPSTMKLRDEGGAGLLAEVNANRAYRSFSLFSVF